MLPGEAEPASRIMRFANYFLDLIGSVVVAFIIGFTATILGAGSFIQESNSTVLSILITSGYYIFFESIWGRTPGKFITGTLVVGPDGQKPVFWRAVLRTLCRWIPFDALSFLFGGSNPVGWHDRFSGTAVLYKR